MARKPWLFIWMLTLLASSGANANEVDEAYNELCVCEDPYTGGRSVPVLVRDFKKSHPDFESFTGNSADLDIVTEDLGADGKPVYSNLDGRSGRRSTTGKSYFDQWYRDVPGVNKNYPMTLELTEISPGIWQHRDMEFFPLDGEKGTWGYEGFPHNYHFTMEMHMKFIYGGGETFTFVGDDDLWVYINGKRAINLGGTHPKLEKTISLDQMADYLGIEPGNTYSFDLFFAERHYDKSRFMFQTTIDLECL